MFTGIVAGTYIVHSVKQPSEDRSRRISITLTDLTENLAIGGSVAINGVCLTVVSITGDQVSFDVIPATLRQTNLRFLSSGSPVNIERSLKLGDEVGGHFLSGHIADLARVEQVNKTPQEWSLTVEIPPKWRKYCQTKGFIALDGVSLTIALFDHDRGLGTVHLIPETLNRSTLGQVSVGSLLNFEVDPMTLAIVDTVERQLNFLGATGQSVAGRG